MATRPVRQARTAAARESLIRDGLVVGEVHQPDVPDIIVRSWRRSLASSVPYDGHLKARYVNNIDPESALIRAATPVLDRLEHDLADVNVAMVLSDDSGQIILRRIRDRTQMRQFDRASAAQGFDFSERSIGTNGLGTVLEEKRPIFVRGAEHYSELLEGFACAGVPITSPTTGRVLGAFSFACSVGVASPLMNALTRDAGRQIESRLLDLASETELHVMRIYGARERRHRGPLIVLSRRTIVANTLGLAHINTETHAQFWETLSGLNWRDSPVALSLQTPVGAVDVRVDRVNGAGESTCFALEIMPQASRHSFQVSDAGPAQDTANQHRLPHIYQQLRQVAQMGETLALAGPAGSGKSCTARDFVEHHLESAQPLVLDVTSFARDEDATWFKEAAAELGRGRSVILRHLQDLAPTHATKVRYLAETSLSGGARLVLTVDPSGGPVHVDALIDQVATIVKIPALASMREDIGLYVRAMVAGFPEPLNDLTLSSQAMQALMRWKWSGNLAELHKVLFGLAQRTRGGLVRLTDLPVQLVEFAQSRGRTPIEAAEREAIIIALGNSNGNRSAAATSLGIGRTTLYRKIREHRIEDSEALGN